MKANVVRVGGLIVTGITAEVFPRVTEILAIVAELTGVVVTEKVPTLDPPGIWKLSGAIADCELLVTIIDRPVAGAADLIFTVPVKLVPPVTFTGVRVNESKAGPLMVRFADACESERLAVIGTLMSDGVALVLMAKVAEDLPFAIETDWGTVAKSLCTLRLTITPSAPAFGVMLTVPVDGMPPVTDAGATVTLVTVWAAEKADKPMAMQIANNDRFSPWATELASIPCDAYFIKLLKANPNGNCRKHSHCNFPKF